MHIPPLILLLPLNFCAVLCSKSFFLPRSGTFKSPLTGFMLGTACLLGQLDSYQHLPLELSSPLSVLTIFCSSVLTRGAHWELGGPEAGGETGHFTQQISLIFNGPTYMGYKVPTVRSTSGTGSSAARRRIRFLIFTDPKYLGGVILSGVMQNRVPSLQWPDTA